MDFKETISDDLTENEINKLVNLIEVGSDDEINDLIESNKELIDRLIFGYLLELRLSSTYGTPQDETKGEYNKLMLGNFFHKRSKEN